MTGKSLPYLAVAAVWIIAAFALGSCGGGWNVPPDASSLKNPVPLNPTTIAAARELYVSSCQKCHGVNGDGRVPPGATYFYSTRPTDFTNARRIDAMSDGEIFWKVTNGRKPMPAFKNRLNDEQRWELVNLVRVFAHPERMTK